MPREHGGLPLAKRAAAQPQAPRLACGNSSRAGAAEAGGQRSGQVALVRLASAQSQALVRLQLHQLQSTGTGAGGIMMSSLASSVRGASKERLSGGSASACVCRFARAAPSSGMQLCHLVQTFPFDSTKQRLSSNCNSSSHPACPSCRTQRASAAAAGPWAAQSAATGQRGGQEGNLSIG